jgi:hypothetical protein
LSDLYIDAKVPRDARNTARVLVRQSDATIVWAEHLGAAFGESCFRDSIFASFFASFSGESPARSGGKF